MKLLPLDPPSQNKTIYNPILISFDLSSNFHSLYTPDYY